MISMKLSENSTHWENIPQADQCTQPVLSFRPIAMARGARFVSRCFNVPTLPIIGMASCGCNYFYIYLWSQKNLVWKKSFFHEWNGTIVITRIVLITKLSNLKRCGTIEDRIIHYAYRLQNLLRVHRFCTRNFNLICRISLTWSTHAINLRTKICYTSHALHSCTMCAAQL